MEIRNMTELTYNGFLIHKKGEMLSLTDMWKAAGANIDRKPQKWLRSKDAKRFTNYLNNIKGQILPLLIFLMEEMEKHGRTGRLAWPMPNIFHRNFISGATQLCGPIWKAS